MNTLSNTAVQRHLDYANDLEVGAMKQKAKWNTLETRAHSKRLKDKRKLALWIRSKNQS